MKYETLNEINAVVKSFENCTVERGEWGHPEHLIVAYHYCLNYDFDTAYKKMKAGIFRLLHAFEVDVSHEMPYHETMTVFWLKTVHAFAASHPNMTADSVDQLVSRYDKYYPGKFYSDDLLMSERARGEFVEPDIRKLEIE